jgi:hypothetical protein
MKTRIPFLLLGIVTAVTGFAQAEKAQNIPIPQLGKRYQLVGKLHVPLGATVRVEAVVVLGAAKGYEGGPNLRVQRIDGRAAREKIKICLEPYFSGWGEEAHVGKTYEMEGYETGDYVGTPREAYDKAGAIIQSVPYSFHEVLKVYRAKQIDPTTFGPRDFSDARWALLQGTARSVDKMAWMKGDHWSVLVSAEPWPADIEEKPIETFGIYNPRGAVEANEFNLVDGKWRLVRLEDQGGRKVELRGRAC